MRQLESWLQAQGSGWAAITYSIGVALALALVILAWGLGLNLSTGRLLAPSQGAVDNGAACAVLLGLAENLHHERTQATQNSEAQPGACLIPQNLKITIVLFSGEEINMQGSAPMSASGIGRCPPAR